MKIEQYEELHSESMLREFDLSYLALGVTEEAGEVAGKVKKLIRDHNGQLSDEYRRCIMKEMGDVFWYLAAMCKKLDTSISEVLHMNIEKLRSRKERGKIQGSGDNR